MMNLAQPPMDDVDMFMACDTMTQIPVIIPEDAGDDAQWVDEIPDLALQQADPAPSPLPSAKDKRRSKSNMIIPEVSEC